VPKKSSETAVPFEHQLQELVFSKTFVPVLTLEIARTALRNIFKVGFFPDF